MQTIWKYELEYAGNQCVVQMPKGAKTISVQVQKHNPIYNSDKVCIWAIVPCQNPHSHTDAEIKSDRVFYLYRTGQHYESINGVYVGTVQIYDVVIHVFEEPICVCEEV